MYVVYKPLHVQRIHGVYLSVVLFISRTVYFLIGTVFYEFNKFIAVNIQYFIYQYKQKKYNYKFTFVCSSEFVRSQNCFYKCQVWSDCRKQNIIRIYTCFYIYIYGVFTNTLCTGNVKNSSKNEVNFTLP